jgi:hypothetical protein
MLLHEAWLPAVLLLWLWWFSIWQTSAFALRKLGAWQRLTLARQANSA